MLRELHREVLDAIRDGKLDSILDKRDTPETLEAEKELDLQWVNANSVHSGGVLTMQIRVTDGGATVEGARLTLRFAPPNGAPYYAQVLTNARGNAEMSVQADEKSLAASSVLVQVSFDGRTATRKFQLRAAM
jgi:ribosomal protein L22